MEKIFKAIWESWKKIAHKVALVQTAIIVTIFYAIIMVPFGVILRVFGWDPLMKKGFKSKVSSNWKDLTKKSQDLESLKRLS